MSIKTSLRSPETTPILPPELWSHIFQFVMPKDLFSIIHVCPEWNELLEERKETFLFPLILPQVMKYVDVKTSLKFRKISKSAKLEVDETLQSFSNSDDEKIFDLHYEESSTQRHLRSVALKTRPSCLYDTHQFRLFLAQVLPNSPGISSSANPFLNGHLSYSYYYSWEPSFLPRNPNLVCLVPKFGHHLSSVRCSAIGNKTSLLPFYHFVSHLRLVPNLKRLEIQLNLFDNPSTCSSSSHLPTDTYDFPPLPKLVLLDVFFVNKDTELKLSFVLEILREYGHQLTAFTCRALLFTLPSLNLEVLNTSFPNLKKFHLLASRSEIPPSLNKLSNVLWRLEKFHLQQNGAYDGRNLNPVDVLPGIYKFYQSLVHLELKIQLELKAKAAIDEEKESQAFKECRNMSHLKIFITYPTNLKFKLLRRFLQESCVALEELHLPTNADDIMMFREEGRWALENIKSLEKVVIWSTSSSLYGKVTKFTMRREETKTS